jgi:hypothetical protein
MQTNIWDKLELKYKPQVIVLAEQVAKHIKEGTDWEVSEVSDFTDSDLAVSFLVTKPNAESIDITFRLLDAEERDGTENGTSFSCDIVAEGGHIVGGFHPYNYSSGVWVDPTDETAVRDRWELFQGATDADYIIALIEQY